MNKIKLINQQEAIDKILQDVQEYSMSHDWYKGMLHAKNILLNLSCILQLQSNQIKQKDK